jgi:para-aminobenzoate synthetase component 1
MLGFYETALVYDHPRSQWYLSGTPIFHDADQIEQLFDDILARLKKVEPTKDRPPILTLPVKNTDTLVSNFTKPQYLDAIGQVIDHIYAGDIYQLNLSQRFQATLLAKPFDLFLTLRQINPSHYGAYLPYESYAVISSSPELFLQKSGDRVETRPIKGTRPRGQSPDQDAQFEKDLVQSPKENAELSMIVDLERNDLGRVCEFGTVVVEEHRYIEPLPTVFHTISTVRGRLRPNVSTVDLLRAGFPGGSITGCPKIRAIQIIDKLEPTRRNVYTGSIGYIGFNGDLSLNIAIRTLITKGDQVYYQVGGGIVADSDPEAEYTETLDKAVAMQRAIEAVSNNHE